MLLSSSLGSESPSFVVIVQTAIIDVVDYFSTCKKIGHIINEIKKGLHQLRSWSVAYIKRSANFIVHTIAR
jgi:hypothetical protein